MKDAFDADVLIYAATPRHPIGSLVVARFAAHGDAEPAGIGSVLLLPEVLSRPTRDGSEDELAALHGLLARLELLPVEPAVADLSVVLGATYRLRAADATHLATAVHAGADRFITNNTRDFVGEISEIAITHPGALADDPAP
ncbi:hypothetical protein BH23ACT2_BH23ACT2_19360 [soil metagenome]